MNAYSEPVVPTRVPSTVTTAVVLTWVAALSDVVAGTALLVMSADSDLLDRLDLDQTQARVLGALSVLVGLAVATVAQALRRGSGLARGLVSTLMVVRVALGVVGLVVLGLSHATEALVGIVIAGFVLWLLWNRVAADFFAAHRS